MNSKSKKSFIIVVVLIIVALAVFLSSRSKAKDKVLIYTSAEDYRVEYLTKRLQEEFPDYDITIEYMSTGNHAAKLLAEGTKTECDITYDLDYGYMSQLDALGEFADLSNYDMSIYTDDAVLSKNFIIEYRNGGAIIINPDVLKTKGIEEPTNSYNMNILTKGGHR